MSTRVTDAHTVDLFIDDHYLMFNYTAQAFNVQHTRIFVNNFKIRILKAFVQVFILQKGNQKS